MKPVIIPNTPNFQFSQVRLLLVDHSFWSLRLLAKPAPNKPNAAHTPANAPEATLPQPFHWACGSSPKLSSVALPVSLSLSFKSFNLLIRPGNSAMPVPTTNHIHSKPFVATISRPF